MLFAYVENTYMILSEYHGRFPPSCCSEQLRRHFYLCVRHNDDNGNGNGKKKKTKIIICTILIGTQHKSEHTVWYVCVCGKKCHQHFLLNIYLWPYTSH